MGRSTGELGGRAPLGESLRKVEAELAAGHAEQALALCQQVQSQYPRALAVQRVLGEVYLTLRKPREALGALERSLAGDPEDARALCARAIIHQMHGDSAAALAWYRRACDVRPDDPMLRASYRELAAHLDQPPYRPTRVGLARLYLRGNLLTHALREWETLVAEHPEQLEAQVGLAETLWRAGRAQVAEEQCRRILANAPSCVKAHVLLAALLLDRGLRDEAQRHADRSAELDPDHRIAQALFADRLAAGDQALAALLSGGPSASRSLAATPRAALPVETQQLLSETEYMLWGPDEETRARAAVAARATATNLGHTPNAPSKERATQGQPAAAHRGEAGQAPQAVPELAQTFGLTKPERSLLINAPVGEGILIARGWPLVDMMCQVYSNAKDRLKGHQMPVLYSARAASVSVSATRTASSGTAAASRVANSRGTTACSANAAKTSA